MKKRFLSILTALALTLSLLPAAALAADGVTEISSSTGLSGLTSGGNFKLTSAVTATEAITISQDVTLDLNGQTLTGPDSTGDFITVSGGTLTLQDSQSNGAIKSSRTVMKVSGSGALKMQGGTLEATGNYTNALSILNSTGESSITGGTIKAVYTPISVTGSKLTIGEEQGQNNAISIQQTGSNAYVMAVNAGSKVTIKSGTFTSSESAAGLLNVTANMNGGSELEISGGEFESKSTSNALFAASTYDSTSTPPEIPSITITGGSFTTARTDSGDYAIINSDAANYFTISGGTFNKSIPSTTYGGYALTEEGGVYKVVTLTDAPVQLTYDGSDPLNYANVESALLAAVGKTNAKVTVKETTTTNLALTIPAGVTLEVESSKTLTCGAITNEGTLTNNGAITAVNGVINEGTVTNSGTITAGCLTAVTGTWNGEGSVALTGSAANVSRVAKDHFSGALTGAEDVTLIVTIAGKVGNLDPGEYTWNGSAFEKVTDPAITVAAGDTTFVTNRLDEALAAVNGSTEGNVTLTLNKNVTNNATLPEVNKDCTLDLGSHTLTTSQPLEVAQGKIVTVKNGELLYTAFNGSALTVKGTVNAEDLDIKTSDTKSAHGVTVDGGKFTMDANSTITAHEVGIMVLGNAPEVEVSGTVTVTTLPGAEAAATAIQGNGAQTTNSTITLKPGAVVTSDGMAIYHPQTGTLTVDDATVTGAAAIGIKRGTLVVKNGSTITGTGSTGSSDGTETGGGITTNGEAICIQGNYDGAVNVTVENSSLAAGNGTAIRVYDVTDDEAKNVTLKEGATVNGNIVTTSDSTQKGTVKIEAGAKVNGSVTAAASEAVDVADGTVTGEVTDSGDVAKRYTVTFAPNGGSGSMDAVLVPSGDEYTLPANSFTAPANKTFDVWDIAGKEYAPGSVYIVSADTTVKALWKDAAPQGGGGGGGSSSSSGGSSTYTVSTDAGRNGDVTVSPSRASYGDTVTITVKPDSGYELDDLTVTDANGDEISVRSRGNNQYTFTMPRGRVTVEATFAEIVEEPTTTQVFSDVPASAYYYDAVYWAAENGVTYGTSATTFSPDVIVSRAQMVTFLWRAHGSPAPRSSVNPFTDITSDMYYYDAVLWAVENGVTNGTSATTFSPDATVTRAQAVTFQWRAAGSPAVSGGSFADVAADAYYAGAVTWAVENGVTNGTGGSNFSPDVGVSRAQAVTFLWRQLA